MPSKSESLWKKMIGKPDSGKPTVRFDEGELEIEPKVTTPVLYSTEDLHQMCTSISFTRLLSRQLSDVG